MLSKKVRIYKFAPDPLPFFCGKIRRYHRSMARRSMKPLSITSYTASSIPTVLRGLPPLGQNMDSKQRRGIRGTFWGFELPRGFHEGATGVPRGCHGGTAGAPRGRTTAASSSASSPRRLSRGTTPRLDQISWAALTLSAYRRCSLCSTGRHPRNIVSLRDVNLTANCVFTSISPYLLAHW